VSQRFVPVLDKEEADKLYAERLLWVANRGSKEYRLDDTSMLPSLSWMYDYAILVED